MARKKSKNSSGTDQIIVHSPAEQAWRRFRKNRLAMFGAGLLIFLILFVIVGCWVSPYDPDLVNLMLYRAKVALRQLLEQEDDLL